VAWILVHKTEVIQPLKQLIHHALVGRWSVFEPEGNTVVLQQPPVRTEGCILPTFTIHLYLPVPVLSVHGTDIPGIRQASKKVLNTVLGQDCLGQRHPGLGCLRLRCMGILVSIDFGVWVNKCLVTWVSEDKSVYCKRCLEHLCLGCMNQCSNKISSSLQMNFCIFRKN